MLMIITQDDLNFENPKNFSINRFLVDYLNNSINDSLRIKTNIHDIILVLKEFKEGKEWMK